MKYLVVSDIHGSGYYAKKIQEIVEKEEPDKIILLGDLYYHGPRNPLTEEYGPQEVAKILNSYKDKILCTRGNCDAEVDEMISDFQFEDHIVLSIHGVDFFFSHGHKYHIGNVPPTGKVIVYGHFHVGFIEEVNGLIFANPGSISLPKSGTEHSYIMIDDRKLVLKDVDGTIIDEKEYIE